MKEFDNINILQIEDNPTLYGLEGVAFNKREGAEIFPIEYRTVKIPCVHFKDNSPLYKHFSLKVLQHPVEVKEYIQLIKDAEAELGFDQMSSNDLKGVVPDMIMFDYLMWQNVETNLSNGNINYNEGSKLLREFINPNFLLLRKLSGGKIKKLQLEEQVKYQEKNFIFEINGVDRSKEKDFIVSDEYKNDLKELSSDELGLYAGILVWNLFRNHITVAIPATHNKTEIKALKTYSKYFEWLHEYELKDMFKEGVREQKTWDDIIPKAVDCLRERIKSMAKESKVSFDLQNLLSLIANKHCELDVEGNRAVPGFYIRTPYGEKYYNLDALFMDVAEERNSAIQYFATTLFKIWFTIEKEFESIENSFQQIFNTYKNNFGDIITLSSLHLRVEYRKTQLNEEDKKVYEKLRKQYTEDYDFSEVSEVSLFSNRNRHLSKANKRLIVLLLATKACIQYLYAIRNNQVSKNLSYPLTEDEYCYILSPVRTEYNLFPLILDMHISEAASLKGAEKPNRLGKSLKAIKGIIENPSIKESEVLHFEKWIRPTEKVFLKTYFSNDLRKIKYNDLPKWLQ